MKRVFVDTSYYVAVLNPQDEHHEAARAWSDIAGQTFVVTDFVLLEVANLVAGSPKRRTMRQFIHGMRADPETVLFSVSKELFDAGLDVYDRRPDKDWSLTDCISFVVMEREGQKEALTADRRFEQAGFQALLL